MISVVEPVCTGLEHVPINTSMLQVIAAAFPGTPLTVSGDPSHLAELSASAGGPALGTVAWRGARVPPRRADFRARLAIELPLVARAANAGDGAAPTVVVLLNGMPSTIVAVKLLHATGRLKVPVQFVLHGGASDLSGWRSRNPLRRLTDLHSAIAAPPRRRIQYIVLEDVIMDRIARDHPGLARDFVGLPHPLLPSEIHRPAPLREMKPLRIGFLGLATRQKGFDVFLRLAERLVRRHPGRVEFHAVGSRPVGEAAVVAPFLASLPSAEKLSRKEFLERIRSLHYVCLPYQGSHYEFTASGVLLDAMANALPVIASRTPTVAKLFEASAPGHCSDDFDDMERALDERIQGLTAERYAREVAAMAAWQRSRLPDTLARSYRAAMRSLLGRVTTGGSPQ